MNCETCQTTLTRLVSGELDEMTADQARAHLQACKSCRTAFEQLGIPLSNSGENGDKEAKATEPELIEAKEAALPAALQKERESRPGKRMTASGEWRLQVGRTRRLGSPGRPGGLLPDPAAAGIEDHDLARSFGIADLRRRRRRPA